jgi:hypothetical protein
MRLLREECVGLRLPAVPIAAGHAVVALAHGGRFVMKDTGRIATATADHGAVVGTVRDFARTVFWRRPQPAEFIPLGLTNPDTPYRAVAVDRVLRPHPDVDAAIVVAVDGGVRFSRSRASTAETRRPPIMTERKKHVRRR